MRNQAGCDIILCGKRIGGSQNDICAAQVQACSSGWPSRWSHARQAEMRTPWQRAFFRKASRINRRTGISRSAHSIRRRPPSASIGIFYFKFFHKTLRSIILIPDNPSSFAAVNTFSELHFC